MGEDCDECEPVGKQKQTFSFSNPLKSDRFDKTGSGQTQGNTEKQRLFLVGLWG
jgi:hypothetical protein